MTIKKRKYFIIAILIALDAVSIVLAALFAWMLTVSAHTFSIALVYWGLANLVCGVGVFLLFRMYSITLNAVGMVDVLKLCGAVILLTAANIIFAAATRQQYIHISTAIIFGALLIYCVQLIRFFKRGISLLKYYTSQKSKTRVMVVGGGSAGIAIIKEMHTSDKISYKPVCIVDDDEDKLGSSIGGIKIVGNTKQVVELAKKYKVEEIFVAMPAVPKRIQGEIINRCKDCMLPVKVLPGIYQFASGEAMVSKMRDVEIGDLLGREQVNVNLDEILSYIENKVVLVTGGGGSIGSELCRQIATHQPKQLIIFDIYENNAYDIEQELKRKYPTLNLLALIGSVRDKTKVNDMFEKYRPQIVFHAAAHKHVPLMETSPNEAVKNNVFGTLNVAKAADKYEAETFVMISTDKAVNPTNVMGATKRICEMIIQTIGRHSAKTKFVAVRFGNVLGSNGSVIPLFKKQIAAGGPVTVTHKDIIRYFMTIPEAVSLVLQAGVYAQGGQIFVLDMGEPVKIYDLAVNLIKLSGLEPGKDIEIVCTGLRPGEKLFEERLMDEEGMQKTMNGLINIARPLQVDEDFFWSTLEKLHVAAEEETDHMKELVAGLVPTYKIDKK